MSLYLQNSEKGKINNKLEHISKLLVRSTLKIGDE